MDLDGSALPLLFSPPPSPPPRSDTGRSGVAGQGTAPFSGLYLFPAYSPRALALGLLLELRSPALASFAGQGESKDSPRPCSCVSFQYPFPNPDVRSNDILSNRPLPKCRNSQTAANQNTL